MGVFKIMRNDLKRILNEKGYLIIVLAVTVITIMLAVFFTSKFQIKANLAVVTNSDKLRINSKYVTANIMNKAPENYELVMGKYDAIILDKGNGNYKIETYKGNDFKLMLENLLRGRKNISVQSDNNSTRKAGANILGYLTMFVLLEGTIFMKFFSEDKVIKAFKRIMTSPLSLKSYIFGHCLFNFMMMYVPTFAIIIFEKEILKVNIGYNYFQYAYLLLILTLLSTAFAFFMTTIIENSDDSMMMSSLIIILTSILSGSFYSFTSKSSIIDKITTILPQKNYMTLIQGIENNNNIINYSAQLIYLLAAVVLLFTAGTIICRRRFNEGKY